jgi:hypothetical protein
VLGVVGKLLALRGGAGRGLPWLWSVRALSWSDILNCGFGLGAVELERCIVISFWGRVLMMDGRRGGELTELYRPLVLLKLRADEVFIILSIHVSITPSIHVFIIPPIHGAIQTLMTA